MELGIIDTIVPEPLGGAHRDYDAVAKALKQELSRSLDELSELNAGELIAQRVEKFARMGLVVE
jgi:acetyl-CoA carboxylase carboxyl transferase subunit alpha